MLETNDTYPQCRICLTDIKKKKNATHPCKCKGTIEFVHQTCLKTWIRKSKKLTCGIC